MKLILSELKSTHVGYYVKVRAGKEDYTDHLVSS